MLESTHQEDNAAEKTRGLTITPYSKGMINFQLVKIPDIHLMRNELDSRAVIYDEKLKITELKN